MSAAKATSTPLVLRAKWRTDAQWTVLKHKTDAETYCYVIRDRYARHGLPILQHDNGFYLLDESGAVLADYRLTDANDPAYIDAPQLVDGEK